MDSAYKYYYVFRFPSKRQLRSTLVLGCYFSVSCIDFYVVYVFFFSLKVELFVNAALSAVCYFDLLLLWSVSLSVVFDSIWFAQWLTIKWIDTNNLFVVIYKSISTNQNINIRMHIFNINNTVLFEQWGSMARDRISSDVSMTYTWPCLKFLFR